MLGKTPPSPGDRLFDWTLLQQDAVVHGGRRLIIFFLSIKTFIVMNLHPASDFNHQRIFESYTRLLIKNPQCDCQSGTETSPPAGVRPHTEKPDAVWWFWWFPDS